MYLQGVGVAKNVTTAIKYLERAQDGENKEASSILAHLYLTNPEAMDKAKGYKYLDRIAKDTKNPDALVLLISTYYENHNFLYNAEKCQKVMKFIDQLKYINEMDTWYEYGYRKYTLGRFDQAITIFTFVALNGHTEALKTLSCKEYF